MTQPNWVTARCDECGLAYQTESEITAMHFTSESDLVPVPGEDMKVWPCPRCGGMATLTSTLTEYVGDEVHTIISANPTIVRDLLAQIRQAAASGTATPAEVADLIEQKAPGLSALSEWLRNNQHLGAWLGAVIAVLAYLSSLGASGGMTAEQFDRVLHTVVQQQSGSGAGPASGSVPGRNAPCWCSSGVKFKHCHGRPGGPRAPGHSDEGNAPGDEQGAGDLHTDGVRTPKK